MRVDARIDHTNIPHDARINRVRALEGLSRAFDVQVEFTCQDADIDLGAMLWSTAAATLTAERHDAPPRTFHGVIEEASYLGFDEFGHRYSLRLRPTLHGLKYRVRTRIFQDLSAVDIIKKVLEDAGVPSDQTRWDIIGTYPSRVYCVQWKESELDFILRLLEDEGIFFWFEHTEIDHTLCFGDAPTLHQPIEGGSILSVLRELNPVEEGVRNPVMRTSLVHDGMKTRDWDFEAPAEPLESKDAEHTARLRYEYPGAYRVDSNGGRLVSVRLQERQRDRQVLRASSNSLRFSEGRKVDLVGAFPQSLCREYVLTQLVHEVRFSPSGPGSNYLYHCDFQAIPSEVPYRPSRTTPRPMAHGLESAVVTGPSGEEIHVDEFGRIKVHFYWDREGAVDDTATCWLRFQQINTHGAMILPRVGWEVHVAFENGDPDRPFAIHKAYNQETMPPYGLPANKTQSSLQSSTSPGGGSVNEVRLQDGSGGMEWALHASRDYNIMVANDENETVGVDALETVGATMACTVGADETGSVGANQSLSVSSDAALETTVDQAVSVGGNDDWGIKASFAFNTSVDRTESIGGLMNVLANKAGDTINGNLNRSVGAVQVIVSATAIGETVGGSKTETVSAAKAIITPGEVAEKIGGTKKLLSGAITIKTGDDVQFAAKAALAVTAAGLIEITCTDDALFTGDQVRITAATAKMKGGGGTFELGSKITIDAKTFGGEGKAGIKVKGKTKYLK